MNLISTSGLGRLLRSVMRAISSCPCLPIPPASGPYRATRVAAVISGWPGCGFLDLPWGFDLGRWPAHQARESRASHDLIRSRVLMPTLRTPLRGTVCVPLLRPKSEDQGRHLVIISTLYLPETTGNLRDQYVLSRSVCAGQMNCSVMTVTVRWWFLNR